MRNLLFLILFFILSVTSVFPQSEGDYRSNGDVSLNSKKNWQTYKNNKWSNASAAPVSPFTKTMTILSNHTLTFNINNYEISGELVLYGNVIISSGVSFSLGASDTLISSQSGKTITVDGTLDFNNYNIVTNYNFIVNGTVSFGNGVLLSSNSATNTFTLNDGATIEIGSPSGITSSGNSGNIRLAGTRTYNAGANYSYIGNTSQITGNGIPSVITGILKINTTGLTLSKSISASVIDMTSGNVYTGNYTFALTTADLRYTAGLIIGSFTRKVTATNTLYAFPLGKNIGSLTQIRGVALTYITLSRAKEVTASFSSASVNGNVILNDNGKIINALSGDGSYSVTSSTSSNDKYNLYVAAEGLQNANTPEQLRIIAKSFDKASDWMLVGNHLNGTGTPFILANRLNVTESNYQFAIAGNSTENPLDGPLPVKLASFSYSVSGNNAKLLWVTESEENNQGFEIYRSKSDGSGNDNWIKAGFITGKGNSQNQTSYTFEDKNLTSGKYNYKLKQIDFNGNYEFFTLKNSVEISTPNKFILEQNYPNPFNPITKISYNLPYDSKVNLSIYDMTGRLVSNLVNSVQPAGYYTMDFNASGLSSGVYIYRIKTTNESGSNESMKKMTLIK